MSIDLWTGYARLQSVLDRTKNADIAAGIETAMSDLLKHDDTLDSNQLQNLVGNRIGKERRHRAIRYARQHELYSEKGAEEAAVSRLTLLKCSEICGEDNFRILAMHALGHTFDDLSAATGTNINTLKTRAHRARKQLIALAA